jgi:hypothetical protein
LDDVAELLSGMMKMFAAAAAAAARVTKRLIAYNCSKFLTLYAR